jgi:ATP-dependent DNA helicase RecG
MQRLQQVLQRLARPLEFAGRDSYARLSTVKDLGAFVSGQIVQALSEDVYPAWIEAELLHLRQLFVDFDQGLEASDRRYRLAHAHAILERLSAESAAERTLNLPKESVVTAAAAPKPIELSMPIQFIKGVGPKKARLFETLGVRTVEDLLWFLPRRYEDRSVITCIRDVVPGMQATISGRVRSCAVKTTSARRMTILELTVEDATGMLQGIFFNQPYLEQNFKPGVNVMLSGRVSAGRQGWTDLRMESPHYEILDEDDEEPIHTGRVVPIYRETRGFTSRQIRSLVKSSLDHYAASLPNLLPDALCKKYRLPHIHTAVRDVHFPPDTADRQALDRGLTPAHRRLIFEELLLFQLALAVRRRSVREEVKGIRFDIRTPLIRRLRALLRFKLTAAQERAISQILGDMGSSRPMNRLVQGDVGSGKTVVALHAMLTACGSGYQAALMAPTEILAEQHYLTLRGIIEQLGLKTVLLTSRGTPRQRRTVLRQIETGEARVVVGTHAIIQKGVQFADLGLAVIDEQHKFGVLQRKTLLEKGYRPDVLIMTATPIPRTLAMTVYGDLDVSIIDEFPPGRKPVRTWLLEPAQRRKAYQLLRGEIEAGRQAYIVYPLVEESEKSDLQAAIQAAERLQTREFSAHRVGLLHGRLKPDERARTMAAFKSGDIQILVATTVIEVGVDVPNASVMLIEHAERFGLAQLHQLRGRVGRGAPQSYCVLLTSDKEGRTGKEQVPSTRAPSLGWQRLQAMVRSSDGFVIAEEDLRIRGPGDFFGLRQWGIPEFRAADLLRDGAMLEEARQEAFALLERDPSFKRPEHEALGKAMLAKWKTKLDLGSVS